MTSILTIFNTINDLLKPQSKSETVLLDDGKRKAFPNFNPFRAFVMRELLRRKNQYPTMPATPFVRMTSTGIDETAGYQFFSLGLHGYDAKGQNIFDLSYANDTNDVVGTAIDIGSKRRRTVTSKEILAGPEEKNSTSNQEALAQHIKNIPEDSRPVPGIVEATIKRSGLGQPLMASVQWVCYNRAQLEFLRNHFLIPGNYVVLEIGQNFADRPVKKMFDFTKKSAFDELALIIGATKKGLATLYGREQVINDYSKPNNGNYDLIVGQIGNFDITYEPETTIYKCTTSIVSQGENVWGIKFDQTSVSLENHVRGEVTTIKDYFLNGMYETFIIKQLADKTNSGIIKELNYVDSSIKGTGEVTDAAKAAEISVNASDYVYLSWKKVFGKDRSLLVDMLAVIKDKGIQTQLVEFLKLDTLAESDRTKDGVIYDRAGYHDNLISCEPESLLLINKNDKAYTSENTDAVTKAKAVYNAGGQFGPTGEDAGHEASLEHGVWLNSGMIRECFVGSVDLKQAITSILLCLNRATANYWQLQLYYDEMTGRYRIIDYKSGSQARSESFYKFNVGPGLKSITGEITNGGECLSVEFDSAFPPELISQMMLMAKFKASSPEEQVKLIKQYPLLSSTSAHVFVLNWSNLTDGLANVIKTWRSNNVPLSVTDTVTAGLNLTTALLTNGQGPATIDRSRSPGLAPGTSMVVPADATQPAPMKTETKEIPIAYVLNAAPVNTDPLIITSVYGMRTDPHDASKRENHEGVDIRVPSGTPVYAVNKGKVIVSANQGERPGENGKTTGYGGFVYIKHSNNFISVYGHLRSRLVNVNDIVEAGEQIGISGGETNDPHHGSSTGPHLHFQLEDESQTPYPRVLDSLIQKANVHGSSDNVQLEVISAKRRTLTANGKIGTPNNPTGADLDNERIQVEANIEAVGLRRAEVTAKFGSNVLTLTELNRGDMISRITLDGYNNVIKPNNFVSPWPTTTSVVVEIMGIAGISVSDGFFVDRIPFTFEQHGVFQVVEVTDEVSPTGWRTKVRGYFKMLWYDANGQSTAIF